MPSFTYKSFLENVQSTLATEYSNMIVSLGIVPMRKPFVRPCLYVTPIAPCIEYEQLEGVHDRINSVYWVWYYAQITGLVALTEKTFESALTGAGSKKGILYTMETAFDFMRGNFMSLTEPRAAVATWDNPAFFVATLPYEDNNFYAACGSFTYKVKLKQVESIELQASPPIISSVSGTATDGSVSITFTTNKAGTTKIEYGKDPNPATWQGEYEDTTETTGHLANISGLDNVNYYFKPKSFASRWWGTTSQIYMFKPGGAGSTTDPTPYNP